MVPWTGKATLQGFVVANTARGATVYTDEAAAYEGLLFNHEAVKHSVAEYVRGMAHTNGVESFWSMLKRAYIGTYHKLSPKHLTGTCRSSPASTTCASQTPSRKWRPLLPALPVVGSCTPTLSRRTAFRPVRAAGDSGRSNARATSSGVAPT